jgi:hypothetical protein
VWEFLKLANSLPGVNRKDVLPYSRVPDNEVLNLFEADCFSVFIY